MGGGGGGYAARLFMLFSFPCSADHKRDWPPCKVVFRVGNQYAECEKQQHINHHAQLLLLWSAAYLLLLLLPTRQKLLLHGGQSRSWSAEQAKKEKRKNYATHPHVCLGVTQVGVTQVVSIRLASVQGFLRLVG